MGVFDELSEKPVIRNVISFFNPDGTEKTDDEIAIEMNKASEYELEAADYGGDVGDTFAAKAGSAAVGGLAGGALVYGLTGGNKIKTAIGALAGAVIMHKIGPELTTDIQRANQYVDQQKASGKSEGKLSDRFSAYLTNIKTKGQVVTPDVSAGPDV